MKNLHISPTDKPSSLVKNNYIDWSLALSKEATRKLIKIYDIDIYDIENLEKDWKRVYELVSIGDEPIKLAIPMIQDKEESKQETLEEAAERLYPTTINSFTDSGFDTSETERLIFKNGAKWQQEQNQIKDIIPALVDFKHECINIPSQCKPDNLLYSFDDIKNALLAGINIYRQSISGMYSNSEVFRNNAIKDYLANIQK
jgi:hypothetical protein